MSEARGAHGVLGGTGIDEREKGKDRSLGPLTNHHRQAVGQFLDRYTLFEGRDVLRQSKSRKKNECDGHFQSSVFHGTSNGLSGYACK